MQVTIVGCGDIGERMVNILLAKKCVVNLLVRQAVRCEFFEKQGVDVSQIDLDRDDVSQLQTAAKRVIWLAPPPQSGCSEPRIRRWLQSLCHDGLPDKIVYISTSGVYGDCGGAWGDESRPPSPQADRSKRRFDAEQQIEGWCQQHQVPYVILRVAGIYGEGRWPLARIKRGDPVVIPAEAAFSNRIHQDDLAQICVAALLRDGAQGIINVSDGQPSTMSDYFQQVARAFSLPELREITLSEAAQQLSPAMLSYLMESRRIDNRKMVKMLALELKYPTVQGALGVTSAD